MSARILVLDAVTTNRIVMTSKLSAAHYTVIACDGQGWEDLLGLGHDAPTTLPDIIILDASVADGTGLELCRTFKTTPQTAHIPIFVTFDDTSDVSAVEAFAAGADDVLPRPFHAQVLLARLRVLIRTRSRLNTFNLPHVGAGRVTQMPAACLRMGIVAENSAQIASRSTELREKVGAQIKLLKWPEVFAGPDQTPAMDLLLIYAHGDAERDPLNMISDLRSRSAWRHSGIIFVTPPDADYPSLSADALNTGADDVVPENIAVDELIARLERQSMLKRRRDTMRQQVQSGLELAVTDPLTGLNNRRYAAERLGEIVRHAHASHESFAVLMLDIDHFKAVNDTYGHTVGDTVLRKISSTLRENLRDSDLLARIGGEEFLVALPMAEPSVAAKTAERLRNVIEKLRFAVSGARQELAVTLSIGMVFSDGSGALEHLLERADKALYSAKACGRNTVTVAA